MLIRHFLELFFMKIFKVKMSIQNNILTIEFNVEMIE